MNTQQDNDAAGAPADPAEQPRNVAVDPSDPNTSEASKSTEEAAGDTERPEAAAIGGTGEQSQGGGTGDSGAAAGQATAQEGQNDSHLSDPPVTDAMPIIEAVHQRARYFENLWHHASKHIKNLESHLRRAGHAPPAMPHVQPLKGAGGDFDPNSH